MWDSMGLKDPNLIPEQDIYLSQSVAAQGRKSGRLIVLDSSD